MENYEKKYKEAFEMAKNIYGASESKDILSTLTTIFPKLKESENWIPKEIIKYLKEKGDFRSCWIAWLEKQGESKFEQCTQEGDKIVTNEDGTHFNVSQLERVAKKEPKFKVGDYLVNDYCKGKVIALTDDAYLLDTKQGIPFSCEHNAHLWTIRDANDGDVLYSLESKQPFIYNCRKPLNQAEAYCGINIYGKFFVWNTKDCVITLDKYAPATKEQCDLLFQKMKEAGYEWSDKDRKLIKIVK